jgi:hypothetical protein
MANRRSRGRGRANGTLLTCFTCSGVSLVLGLGVAGCTQNPESPYACGSHYEGEVRVATWWGKLDSEKQTLTGLEGLVSYCNQNGVVMKETRIEKVGDSLVCNVGAYPDKQALQLRERELLPLAVESSRAAKSSARFRIASESCTHWRRRPLIPGKPRSHRRQTCW